jgi:nucleoredoxin
MDSLSGQTLVKSDGSSISADSALEGKDIVLFYFSAHWCPPCRQFTPMLKDFYEVTVFMFTVYTQYTVRYMMMLQEVEGLEIVFISSDRSPEDMTSYMKESHGDWLAVPHNSTVANDLKQKYGDKNLYTFCFYLKDILNPF